MYYQWGHGWRGQFEGVPKTNDGTIPYKLMLFMLSTADVIRAGRELELVNSVSLGVANAFNGKEDKSIGSAILQLRKKAYPLRYD